MTIAPYEHLLSVCSDRNRLIALIREFRPYLELLPSLRRPDESVISIPLPLVRLRETVLVSSRDAGRFSSGDLVHLPCDVGVIMCDPEWQIKTGAEIFIFIHRPQEDFSTLLRRWRQTQMWTDRGYDWVMPTRYQHIFSEGAQQVHPLFILTEETSESVVQGLTGASLPFIRASTEAADQAIPPRQTQALDDIQALEELGHPVSGKPNASELFDFPSESGA
ncbi:MAG: hypothetical protein ACFB4J_19415 [Elainellaceae cyanobacterium]